MNNEHLEALRTSAKARFDGAKTAEEIKAATEELSHLDEIEKEEKELTSQNATLLASYKEIVKKEPVTTKAPKDSDEEEEGQGLSFEDALKKVLDARPKQ